MFRTVKDFEETWNAESKSTLRIFNALRDDSLAQAVALMHQAGLTVPGVYGPSEADKAGMAAKK